MPPMAMAAPRPATAPTAILRRPMRWPAAFAIPRQSRRIWAHRKTNEAADRSAAPLISSDHTYFRLVIAVRSAESLTMPAAPPPAEPKPPGLMGVMKAGLKLVVAQSLVNTLQLALERLVSE